MCLQNSTGSYYNKYGTNNNINGRYHINCKWVSSSSFDHEWTSTYALAPCEIKVLGHLIFFFWQKFSKIKIRTCQIADFGLLLVLYLNFSHLLWEFARKAPKITGKTPISSHRHPQSDKIMINDWKHTGFYLKKSQL